MEENYLHPEMNHLFSGRQIELDIYIKSLKLAVEYQGEQHYKPLSHLSRTFEQQQTRDEEKKKACEKVISSSFCWQVMYMSDFVSTARYNSG